MRKEVQRLHEAGGGGEDQMLYRLYITIVEGNLIATGENGGLSKFPYISKNVKC